MTGVPRPTPTGQDDPVRRDHPVADREDLVRFRQNFYRCLPVRADALFELTDAVLCGAGPVRSSAELSPGKYSEVLCRDSPGGWRGVTRRWACGA